METALESGKYTLNTFQTLGVKLIESVYPANLRMPHHTHDAASFCIVLRGAYDETDGRKSQVCKASTITIYPPQHKHAVNFGNVKAHTLDAVISNQRYEQICEYSSVMNYPKIVCNSETVYSAKRLYREFSRPDEISPLAIEGIILEILAELARSGSSQKVFSKEFPRWLKRVDEYLHEHFSESLNLEEIAQIAGVHSAHLTRVFRGQFNCTIGEYVRELRIESAARQLSGSDAPLSEIALSTGFADQSHFTRTFKAQTGMTPAEYRNIFADACRIPK